MSRNYYGALCDRPTGTKPPSCYGRHYMGMEDYSDAGKGYVVLIFASNADREASIKIASENGCGIWKVNRSWLRKSERDQGLRFTPDGFRDMLESGNIFPMIDKGFEKVKETVLKYGWFDVTGVLTSDWSQLVTGSLDHENWNPIYFGINYEQMQELNRLLKEKECPEQQ